MQGGKSELGGNEQNRACRWQVVACAWLRAGVQSVLTGDQKEGAVGVQEGEKYEAGTVHQG